MFKLTQGSTFWWPIEFDYPSEDKRNKFERQEFQAQFRRVTNTEMRDFYGLERTQEQIVDFLTSVFLDFDDIEYDEEALTKEQVRAHLLDDTAINLAILKGFIEATTSGALGVSNAKK